MDINYRPANERDFDFLYRLHALTMREYVEDTFGPWDEAFQQAYFRKKFDPAAHTVIQWGGEDVGVLYVQNRTEELFIASLEILPAYQRRGIGTAVIRMVQESASRQGKPVALQVLKANIAARGLYQRLGFGVTGENDTHYIMAFTPDG
jgi:ribosomal protein S18 acetylase RimI-like enzyme